MMDAVMGKDNNSIMEMIKHFYNTAVFHPNITLS